MPYEQGLLSVIEFKKQMYMTEEQLRTMAAEAYNRLGKNPPPYQWMDGYVAGYIAHQQLLQQTPCYTMLPPDVTLRDIKEIRNYFGEHDATCFEHKAFSILSRLINHLETSGGNIV